MGDGEMSIPAAAETAQTRLLILDTLTHGTQSVRDIVDQTDRSRSTVSRAVSDLEDAGFAERADGGYRATLTFAGHDTTAVLLTYALHQLGQHDSVRERFHDELATQLGGEAPTLTDVQDLPVTRRVINETLRAYPPIHTIPRETVRSVEIEGYQLAPNTRTHLHTWALHRDPEHWETPNEWRPSRWQDSTPSDRGFTFVPFGAGPRACLCRRFARLEATLVLAIIGQQFHLEPQRDPSYEPMSTLQPTDEVPVTVHER